MGNHGPIAALEFSQKDSTNVTIITAAKNPDMCLKAKLAIIHN